MTQPTATSGHATRRTACGQRLCATARALRRIRPRPLSTSEWRAFGLVLGLALLGRFIQVFVPLFSSDDAFLAVATAGERAYVLEGWMGQGRFLQVWLNQAQAFLDMNMASASLSGALLFTATLAWAGVMLARLWWLRESVAAMVLVALPFALFPFFANQYSFRFCLTTYALSLFLAIYGMLLVRARSGSILPASALLCLSLAAFQTAFITVAVATVCAQAVVVLRAARARRHMRRQWARAANRVQANRVMAMVLAFVAYMVVFRSYTALAGLPRDTRTGILSPEAFPQRLQELRALFAEIALGTHPMLTPAISGGIGVMLCLVPAIAALHLRGRFPLRIPGVAIAILLIFATGFLLAPGFIAASAVWWPSSRGLVAFAVIPSALVAVGVAASGRHLVSRRFVLGAAGLVSLLLAQQSHHAGMDQWASNQRDLAIASRMLVEIARHDPDGTVTQVAFHGTDWDMRHGIPTAHLDMNISCFAHPWSQRQLLNLVSHREYNPPSGENHALGEQLFKEMRPWPQAGSVRVENGCAFILLRFH
jgi:hypothetical protein